MSVEVDVHGSLLCNIGHFSFAAQLQQASLPCEDGNLGASAKSVALPFDEFGAENLGKSRFQLKTPKKGRSDVRQAEAAAKPTSTVAFSLPSTSKRSSVSCSSLNSCVGSLSFDFSSAMLPKRPIPTAERPLRFVKRQCCDEPARFKESLSGDRSSNDSLTWLHSTIRRSFVDLCLVLKTQIRPPVRPLKSTSSFIDWKFSESRVDVSYKKTFPVSHLQSDSP